MHRYRIEATPSTDADVEGAFDWYESEEPGLIIELLTELQSTYDRIADGPFGYQEIRPDVRRALLRRFPYGVYFSVMGDLRCGIGSAAYRERPRGMAKAPDVKAF